MKIRFNKHRSPKPSTKPEVAPEKKPMNVFVRAEKQFIESARQFAKENNYSLSGLVENYFKVIHARKELPMIEYPASKLIKGKLKETRLSRSDYLEYLREKYK